MWCAARPFSCLRHWRPQFRQRYASRARTALRQRTYAGSRNRSHGRPPFQKGCREPLRIVPFRRLVSIALAIVSGETRRPRARWLRCSRCSTVNGNRHGLASRRLARRMPLNRWWALSSEARRGTTGSGRNIASRWARSSRSVVRVTHSRDSRAVFRSGWGRRGHSSRRHSWSWCGFSPVRYSVSQLSGNW